MLINVKSFSGVRRVTKISYARENEVTETETESTETETESTETETESTEVTPVAKAKNDTPPVLPQEKVNKLLAEERRKNQEKIRKLTAEMESFRKNASMTEAEKAELATRLDELNSTLLSKEEIAAKRLKEAKEKAATELETAKQKAQLWQGRFERSLIERTILDAAGPEAVFPAQFIPVLAPHARVVEKTDDAGHPTDEFEVKVKIKSTDSKGNEVVLDLPVNDAVQDLKKQPTWQNLFKSAFTAGTGFTPGEKGPGTAKDFTNMSPEEYRKHRKSLGLSR